MIFPMISKCGPIFFHFVTNDAFDRQTDEKTEFLIARPHLHSMQKLKLLTKN